MKDIELKAKDAEKKIVPVTLPEGKLSAYGCCGDCKFGDYDSSRGQVWCGKFHSWEDRSSSCRYWEQG